MIPILLNFSWDRLIALRAPLDGLDANLEAAVLHVLATCRLGSVELALAVACSRIMRLAPEFVSI